MNEKTVQESVGKRIERLEQKRGQLIKKLLHVENQLLSARKKVQKNVPSSGPQDQQEKTSDENGNKL